MQIVITGMHRSGTSLIAGIVNQIGAYLGPESEVMQPSPDNNMGYWERWDVVHINDRVIQESKGHWAKLSEFDSEKISPTSRTEIQNDIKQLLAGLNTHHTWLAKDPRFCLTLDLWKPCLNNPIYIVVLRHPLEIAHSIRKRDRFPAFAGLAIWEDYFRRLFSSIEIENTIFVYYDDFLENPKQNVKYLFEALKDKGASGIHLPSDAEVANLVKPGFKRNTFNTDKYKNWGSELQTKVWAALQEKEYKKVATLFSEPLSEETREELKAFETIFDVQHARHVHFVEAQEAKKTEDKLKVSLEDTQNRNSILTKEITELKKTSAAEKARLLQRIDQEKNSIIDRLSGLTEKLLSFQNQNFELTLKVQKLSETTVSQKNAIEKLSKEKTLSDSENKETRILIEGLRKEKSLFETRKNNSEKLLEEIKAELSTLKETQSKIIQKNTALKENNSALEMKVSTISSILNQIETNLGLYQQSLRFRLGKVPVSIATLGKGTKTALDSISELLKEIKEI